MNLPSLGNDTVPGIIPAAPKLLNPGQSGYTFLIDGATDDLVLIVQTAPGVGDQNSFTR